MCVKERSWLLYISLQSHWASFARERKNDTYNAFLDVKDNTEVLGRWEDGGAGAHFCVCWQGAHSFHVLWEDRSNDTF